MAGAVVVTGASSGIGRAASVRLARIGFEVFAGVRDPEHGEAVRAEGGERVTPVLLDVTDPDHIATAAATVADAVGDPGLAGLVNNAGYSVAGPIEFVPIDQLRAQLEVNLVGQVAVTQAFLPALRAARGRIVFISSVGGRVANPFVGPYAASKFGLEATADSLRVELSSFGVRVVVVEPGAVATEIWRKGQDDAARMRADLSPEAERLYGRGMDAVGEAARQAADRAVPPERVAAVIEHALTAERPRTRYVVGREARMMIAARRLLGDRGYDRLVRRVLRL